MDYPDTCPACGLDIMCCNRIEETKVTDITNTDNIVTFYLLGNMVLHEGNGAFCRARQAQERSSRS